MRKMTVESKKEYFSLSGGAGKGTSSTYADMSTLPILALSSASSFIHTRYDSAVPPPEPPDV
jgi:hypothetical protein